VHTDGKNTLYDPTGQNQAARLTIDLAAGDRYLIGLTQYATANWLTTSNPVLDYANAMVPNKQPNTSRAESNWQEHVDGKPQYSPPIGPLAPAKFTGSLYIVTGQNPAPECAISVLPWRIQPAASYSPLRQMVQELQMACSATCSGQRNAKGHTRSARRRRTHARAVSAWVLPPTIFRSPCKLYVRINRSNGARLRFPGAFFVLRR
jgi:hypothetical protein